MIDPRPVGYILGLLVATLGALMLVPMALDLAAGDRHWLSFAETATITTVAGSMLALACANGRGQGTGLSLQQSFLLTTGAWVLLPVFGALPFMMGRPDASFTDAVFEAMSGFTTTGTVGTERV